MRADYYAKDDARRGQNRNSRLEREFRVLLNNATGTDQREFELEASGIHDCKEQTTPSGRSCAKRRASAQLDARSLPRNVGTSGTGPSRVHAGLSHGIDVLKSAVQRSANSNHSSDDSME